jgi:hypothetical protein
VVQDSWKLVPREGDEPGWIGLLAPIKLSSQPPAAEEERFTSTDAHEVAEHIRRTHRPPQVLRRVVDYQVRMRVARDKGGNLIVTAMTLEADEGRKLTASSLHKVPLGAILDALAQDLDTLQAIGIEFTVPEAPVLPSRQPGRAGHPDEHYQTVARIYREAGGRKPIRFVSERYGSYSENTVKGWVAEARKRGYLPRRRGASK